MKIFIGFGIGAVVTAAVFWYFQGSSQDLFAIDRCIKAGGTYEYETDTCMPRNAAEAPEAPDAAAQVIALLSRAAVTVPETDGVQVQLQSGSAEYTASGERGIVTMGDVRAVLEGRSRSYAVAPFTVARGGSGTFVYIGLFRIENDQLVHTGSVLVGDRVAVAAIEPDAAMLAATVRYLDRDANDPMAAPPTREQTLRLAVMDGELLKFADDERVRVEAPAHSTVTSPLAVAGAARGQWYFEASFPIALVDADGAVVAEVPASATGEWMTEEFVPFRTTIAFPPQEKGSRGALILMRNNASGLPEHDAAIALPVTFQ